MTYWCTSRDDNDDATVNMAPIARRTCPSCGHRIQVDDQGEGSGIQDLSGLPAGVKFDPTDPELLEHLEGKVRPHMKKVHPLVDEFIPTIDGENGICYTHPEKLPGVKRDGLIRHFFHRPSKAYTIGTRKRRKVHTDELKGETRWHKTGKTRPIYLNQKVKGFKKILVLYRNYGKLRKPEKTNWVTHQYHLGVDEEEKDGELVVSKIFYQTHPRQSVSSASRDAIQIKSRGVNENDRGITLKDANIVEYCNSSLISHSQGGHHRASSPHLMTNFAVHAGGSSFHH